jgi:hypothetical protein
MKVVSDVRSLVLSGGFGAAFFAVMFAIGQILIMATGIVMVGGIISVIPEAFVATIGAMLVRRFGAVTIMGVVASALAIPTTSLGPPGVYKLLVGFGIGLVWDILIEISRRKSWGYIVGAGIGCGVSIPMLFVAISRLGLPAAERLLSLLPFLTILYFILGAVGALLGILFFNKRLKNLSRVKAVLAER